MASKVPQAPAKTAERPAQPSSTSVQDRIRARAYELYQARNGAPGDPESDWYRAEAEIAGQSVESSK